MMQALHQLPMAVRQYMVITLAYWSFTITDGALRMLVLLYFYQQGYSAFDVALLFVLYEFCGLITNLVGGWVGARFGLRRTLFAGMALQILALLLLAAPVAWLGILYVMGAQALSGIAKDLNKMSAKTSVKLLAPSGQSGQLFKWVALLTGSKNALKGVGYFVGTALLTGVGFQISMLAMAAWIGLFMLLALLWLRQDLGRTRAAVPFVAVFSSNPGVNLLSAARLFLFGARDIWFVVALPVFLHSVLNWHHVQIGTFMALWIIGYGVMQALAPGLVRLSGAQGLAQGRRAAMVWSLLLAAAPALICIALWQALPPGPVLILGLGLFGLLFAVNSSVHSWLILEYARDDGAAMDVGFYYMANAAGRLIGTLLSGWLYVQAGLVGCLLGTLAFVLLSSVLATRLPRSRMQA